MSIYQCFSLALKDHKFSSHVQNIKINPDSQRAPTTVSFGPDVVIASTSVHVSHSEAVQYGYGVDGKCLVGRSDGDDGWRLVFNGGHVQVGLGHGGAHHTQG